MTKSISILFFIISIGLGAQNDAQNAFNDGVQQLKSKSFNEAQKSFSIAIEKGETQKGLKMSYIYKGFALNGLANYDSSIVCFTKAIEIDSLDPATYTDRGKTYSFKKDYSNAIKDFKKVLTIDSTGGQAEAAYYYLGLVNMLRFKDEMAIQYFDSLLKLAPRDAEAYFLRGTAKSNIMLIDESISDFNKAIEIYPNYMQAFANRGTQKLNKLTVEERLNNKDKCLAEPCADFLTAKQLGDSSVDDMIYLYCQKCK